MCYARSSVEGVDRTGAIIVNLTQDKRNEIWRKINTVTYWYEAVDRIQQGQYPDRQFIDPGNTNWVENLRALNTCVQMRDMYG
jgi:hypothetical protein